MTLIRDNQGEGRYVVMRGLEQRYNNTLIDGIKIPSPESKDRLFRWIFFLLDYLRELKLQNL